MDIENTIAIMEGLLEILDFVRWRRGSVKVEYSKELKNYVISGQNYTTGERYEFDLSEDGMPLGTYRKADYV